MQQQKKKIAIRLQYSATTWMATERKNSRCLNAGKSNLIPDRRPWYVRTQA